MSAAEAPGDPRPPDGTGTLPAVAPAFPRARFAGRGWRRAGEYVLALGAMGFATLAAWAAHPLFTHADKALLYILAVLLVATRVSRGPSMLAAVAGVLSFDYFFVEPEFAIVLADPRFVVTFCVMLAVGLTVSGMTARIREQAVEATERERTTAALYAMTRDLLGDTDVVRLAHTAARHIRDLMEAEVVVLLGTPSSWLFPGRKSGAGALSGPAEEEAARCAFESGHPSGGGTRVVPEAAGLYLPLGGGPVPMGVVGVAAGDGDGTPLPAAELRLLETLVAQTALALERARLAEESASARVAFEAERTRSALLRTVSHDLRTPLASVRGAAEVLLEPGQGPTDPAQREMLETIRDEARRLTRLVNDLLDLTRLESETFRVRKEWCPVEEIVGSALGRMEEAVKGRDVRVDLPGDLLMVPVDIVLVEQVLMNLLDNATRYSPAGSPVEIRARAAPGAVFVEVLDRGPGIPPGLERRIFEPFFRAGGGAGAEGTGLGLAVCEAVMRVHGGAIEALARDGGGTVMRFTFPAEGAAPPVEEAA